MKQERGCCTAPSGDTQPAYRPTLLILLKIKDFPGTKSAGNGFSLSVGKRTFAKILLIPAKPILRIRYGGEFPPGLRPSTAVRDGCRFASLTPSYLSLGFRFAASRTAGAHLCPSGAVQDGCHFTSFIPACPSPGFRPSILRAQFEMVSASLRLHTPISHWASASQPSPMGRRACRGRWPMQAGGSVVSKEASQAPPARCEATIANLTEAKQEVAARRADG